MDMGHSGMEEPSILSYTFSDLLLGADSAYLKTNEGIRSVPPACHDEIKRFYNDLSARQQQDFLYRYKDEYFRAARMDTVAGSWFALRRACKQIQSLSELGFPRVMQKYLLNQEVLPSGLLIFAGRTGAGKTTSACGMIKDRLDIVGGVAVTIEDPPELPLHGDYTRGICFQREAHYTKFADCIVDSMRYASPDIIFLGELREPKAVSEALRAAVNGHLIVATIHTPDVQATIQRLYTLARAKEGPSAAGLLAEGFSGVIHQRLEETLQLEILLAPEKNTGVRAKIRQEKFHQLSTDIQEQMNKFFLGV